MACAGVSASLAYRAWESLQEVERYARKRYRHWDQRWLHRREQRLVAELFADHGLGGTILDAPVGYGRFQAQLAQFGQVHALDANTFALLYQRSTPGLAKSSSAGRAEGLPYRDDSFDVVFSLRLLQHIHERDERIAILEEFKRVSRRWVLASLYLRTALHRLHRRMVRQPSRITMLSRHDLEYEAATAGLALVQVRAVLPFLHSQRLCLFTV